VALEVGVEFRDVAAETVTSVCEFKCKNSNSKFKAILGRFSDHSDHQGLLRSLNCRGCQGSQLLNLELLNVKWLSLPNLTDV
jgi:hypothetical protein